MVERRHNREVYQVIYPGRRHNREVYPAIYHPGRYTLLYVHPGMYTLVYSPVYLPCTPWYIPPRYTPPYRTPLGTPPTYTVSGVLPGTLSPLVRVSERDALGSNLSIIRENEAHRASIFPKV